MNFPEAFLDELRKLAAEAMVERLAKGESKVKRALPRRTTESEQEEEARSSAA
jgi:hypothetical protein